MSSHDEHYRGKKEKEKKKNLLNGATQHITRIDTFRKCRRIRLGNKHCARASACQALLTEFTLGRQQRSWTAKHFELDRLGQRPFHGQHQIGVRLQQLDGRVSQVRYEGNVAFRDLDAFGVDVTVPQHFLAGVKHKDERAPKNLRFVPE